MAPADSLHDGYNEPGFIAAAPGWHGGLRFAFRPALVEERSQLEDAARQLSSAGFERHVTEFLAKKIIAWDWLDERRQPAAVVAKSLLKMPPELLDKLNRIVLGIAASDVDPSWPAETRERLLALAAEAAASDRTVGEIREEQDEKNCCWG